MNAVNVRVAAFAVLTFAGLTPALAEQGPWGTPEETKPCLTFDSPECKAEIDKRAQNCMNDPREASNLAKSHEWYPNDKAKGDAEALKFCADVATKILKEQMEDLAKKQKEAEKDKAKLESTEMPTAKLHDPKLEKAVAAAYKKDYPEGKVLKVILGEWSDDYEKDAFGRVTGRDLGATVVNKQPDGKCQLHDEYWMQHGNGKSFSGPLSSRGAGSLTKTEILCSKVEGKR
jgi:hypothetical protein